MGRPVAESRALDRPRNGSAPHDTTPLGVYVHVPFCVSRCGYCDFFTVAGSSEPARDRYVDLLAAEIAARGTGERIDTVYFGGGTPSLLGPEQVARVLGAVFAAFEAAPGAEITMEANPETVTPPLLAGWRAAGVNRLSFGLQTFDDGRLRALQRAHDAARGRAAVREAAAAGFGNLSGDLMFGLPGQSVADWSRDLDEALALPLTHLSCYELILEDGTPFAASPPALPSESEVVEQWEVVLDRTARAGLARYEVSNYARPGFECRHNVKYWRDEPFFGFGASAWESRGGARRGNPRSLKRYAEGRDRGFPPAESESRSLAERMGETLMLNLRLGSGCSAAEFDRRYGPGAFGRYEEIVAGHLAAGRLERDGERIRLTDRGLLVANEVWADVIHARDGADAGAPGPGVIPSAPG